MIQTTTRTRLDHDNPWPGLESYEEEAQYFFYGRERKIEELLNKVLDAPVTVLFGRSGLGKTSLLRAGLFPLLREHDFLPIYVRFEIGPSAAPLTQQLHDSVRDSIRDADLPDAMLPADDESLWEYLHRSDFELWSQRNYPLTPVIVLDQFEELFTLGQKWPDRVDALRNQLGDLAENRIPAELAAKIKTGEVVAGQYNLRSRNYKLLISLREDYLPHLDEWRRLIPALGRSRMRLLPLKQSEALDAVSKPGAGLMTNDLARRVVEIIAGADVRPGHDGESAEVEKPNGERKDSDVDPALLSLFCRELNEIRKRNGQEHFDSQLIEKNKDTTLTNYYSSCVSGLDASVAEFIETELISEKGFRNFYPLADAVPSRLTEEDLAHLVDSRLVRVMDHYGAQRIELTHDVLTRAVREHRDKRRAEGAREHARALEEAAAQREVELDRERRARRRLRKLTVALAFVCAAAVGLAAGVLWFNYQAENRLHEAMAERLSARGQLMLLWAQPGSEVEAFDKILAAQQISDKPGIGGLLTALISKPRLRHVIHLERGGSLLNADGSRVATVTDEGIRVLDAVTGDPIGMPFADSAWKVRAMSQDGRYVAVTHEDDVADHGGDIRVWDSTDGRQVGQLSAGGDIVPSIAISPDGNRLAASVFIDQGTVRLWDVRTGRQLASRETQRDVAMTMEFDRTGRSLAMGTFRGNVTVWDTTKGTLEGAITQMKDTDSTSGSLVRSLAFAPDGQTIAAGGSEGGTWLLRSWSAESGERINTVPSLDGSPNSGDVSIAFSADGGRIVTGSTDGNVAVRDTASGKQIGDTIGFLEPVTNVAFHDGRIISISGRSLSASDPDPMATMAAELPGSKAAHLAGSDQSFAMYIRPEGPRIMVVDDDTLRWVDPDTGAQIGDSVVSDSLRGVSQIDISPDEQWMALAGQDADIRIIDASNGKLRGVPIKGHTDTVTQVVFSPDGQTLASVSLDQTIRLWDWRTGTQIAEAHPKDQRTLESVFFNGDGDRLFTRTTDSIRVWDRELHPVGEPITGRWITSMAFAEDRGVIAAVDVVDGSHIIQEYDAESGGKIGEPLSGHTSNVADIAYTSDGRYLVSVGQDYALRFWDMRSGEQIGMKVPTRAVGDSAAVALSHDDRRVFVTARRDPATRSGGGIWEVPGPAEWGELVCAKLDSNPTEDQWNQWVSEDIEPTKELCPNK
jgi:WD40 repeat protein